MPPLAELLPTTDLLVQVRSERAVRDAADVRILVLATEWADRHTVDPSAPARPALPFLEERPGGDPDDIEWRGLPTLRWDTVASFAAALGMPTAGGRALVRDALVLQHRLPRVWERIIGNEVQAWRGRRIAQTVLGAHDDVVAYVDAEIAHRAAEIGMVTLDLALDEAMLRLHPEEREIAQLEALDARYARLDERSLNHTGVADFAIRGDWADLSAFDDSVGDVAAALARSGCEESLDVRRSMAVGVLADPERALAVLTDGPPPRAQRRIALTVHLGDANLLGLDPVTLDADGRPLLDQVVRDWCGRPDMRVWVRPIRHCGGCADCSDHPHDGPDPYVPTARDRERVELRDRHCVFPFCTRAARRCDCDHVVPHARGGPTCACNLAALCRHHHRLKTHAGWTYTIIEPGVYLWLDRYGQHFLRTRDGTTDLTRTS